MTKKKEQPFNNPFGAVTLKQPAAAATARPAPPKAAQKQVALDEEAALFLEAVGEVAPVRAARVRVGPPEPPTAAQLRIPNEEAESLARLAELVSAQGAFEVSDSSEFVEGSVAGFDGRVLKKLRAGEFSTQAQLDLHGLTQNEARPTVDRFIQASRVAGHRCVLIVTGRGLHSEDQVPVLKAGVQQWLTRGKTAHQVLAFVTARPKDGGSGALYVLLRR